MDRMAELLKARPEELADRVEGMVTRLKDAERELARLRSSQLTANIAGIIGTGTDVGATRIWTFRAPDGVDAAALRELVVKGRSFVRAEVPALVVGAAVLDGKVSLVAATNDAGRAHGLSAAAALRAALPAVAGRGGGKDDLAQGGGTDPAGVEAALAAVVEQVRSGPA